MTASKLFRGVPLILALILSLSGCVVVGFEGQEPQQIIGSGGIEVFTYNIDQLAYFEDIHMDIGGEFDITFIHNAEKFALTIEASRSLAQYFNATIHLKYAYYVDGIGHEPQGVTLVVWGGHNIRNEDGTMPRLRIYVPEGVEYGVSSWGSITSEDIWLPLD
jgi:hypothetical protein